MHSKDFEMVKEKYRSGKWTVKMLLALAQAGRITMAEYEEIISEGHG